MEPRLYVSQQTEWSLAYEQLGKNREMIRRAVDGRQRSEESYEVMNEWRM